MRPVALAVLAAVLSWTAIGVGADEGMWTFDNVPRALIKQKYAFEITDLWLEHVRLATVRVGDGGSPPSRSAEIHACSPTAGRWYCVSVYDVGNGVGGQLGDLGLILHTGRFLGTSLLWSGPRLIAGGTSGGALDSPRATIDPIQDRIYVAYSNFSSAMTWGQIEVVTLGNHGSVTLYTTIVQPQVLNTNNAGADVALGPDGEVYVAYESGLLTNNGQGPAFQYIARSLDRALCFSTPVLAGTVNESWLSGPPGFNREEEFVEYPSPISRPIPGQSQLAGISGRITSPSSDSAKTATQ